MTNFEKIKNMSVLEMAKWLQGYKNAQKEIRHLFDLHLNVSCKKEPPTKMQLKALEKFNEFISESEDKE